MNEGLLTQRRDAPTAALARPLTKVGLLTQRRSTPNAAGVDLSRLLTGVILTVQRESVAARAAAGIHPAHLPINVSQTGQRRNVGAPAAADMDLHLIATANTPKLMLLPTPVQMLPAWMLDIAVAAHPAETTNPWTAIILNSQTAEQQLLLRPRAVVPIAAPIVRLPAARNKPNHIQTVRQLAASVRQLARCFFRPQNANHAERTRQLAWLAGRVTW